MICARWTLGDREAARSLYKRVGEFARSRPVERFERSNAMNRLPTILAAIGDYEAAFRMVEEEIDGRLKGSQIHSVVEVVARSSGLTSHANEARAYPPIDGEAARSALRLAAKFAGGSRHDDIRNALRSIAIYQAKLGDLEGARQSSRVLAAAGDGEAGAATGALLLIELARAEWKAGAREAAEADFASALRAADTLPERSEQRFGRWPTTTHPRDGAIVAVVLARAGLGDVGGAIEAAARVREPVEKANALASAAGNRRDDKDLAGAARLAKAEGHGFPSIGVLVGIADAQDRARDLEGSRATLRFALQEAEDYLEKRPHDPTIPPHNPSMVITHWDRPPEGRDREIRQHATAAFEVAEIRSKLGDTAGALRALESVADEKWREGGLLGTILNQFRAGDAHGAFARAYQLPTASRRLTAIFCLSGAVKSLKSTTGPRPPAP
jgi:tetratricopeptide (TPR) repeat protein